MNQKDDVANGGLKNLTAEQSKKKGKETHMHFGGDGITY
jgi:hypothetical protein